MIQDNFWTFLVLLRLLSNFSLSLSAFLFFYLHDIKQKAS